MTEIKDRCTKIAELLLLENEIIKIEDASNGFYLKDLPNYKFYQLEIEHKCLSPIEKIMYSILDRIKYDIFQSYSHDFNIDILPQEKIGSYIVDFLVIADFSDDKVIIECDGHDFHEKTKEQAKHDKERDRYLTSLGYKILRYAGSEIYNNFLEIEKELSILIDVPTGKSLFGVKKDEK